MILGSGWAPAPKLLAAQSLEASAFAAGLGRAGARALCSLRPGLRPHTQVPRGLLRPLLRFFGCVNVENLGAGVVGSWGLYLVVFLV